MLQRLPVRAAVLFCASLRFAAAAVAQQRAVEQEIPKLAGPGTQTLLLYFVSSDCPVSNRYFPEMERIAAEFAPAHVTARYVYPNPEETPAAVAAHQRTYGAPPNSALLDPEDTLVHTAGVTTTPEAALLQKTGNRWQTVWHGRIDDRYVHFGVERAQVQHHDLEAALHALSANRELPHPEGPPVGCGIVPASAAPGAGH